MEREWSVMTGIREPRHAASTDEFVLPTRSAAKAALRSALHAQTGPVLLTGDPGTGKTWLYRLLIDEMPAPWRWLAFDVTPTDGTTEFYRLVGYGLGLIGPRDLGTSRLALADYLRESSANGDRWVLVVDEAHNLAPHLIEEIRVLANRLGASDGFAGIVLVGQTLLARRLSVRPLSTLETRLAARLHLRPLDIEEAGGLLARLLPNHPLDHDALDLLHRDALGNPRRLIKLAGGWTSRLPAPKRREERPIEAPRTPAAEPAMAPLRVKEAEPVREPSVLAASKPPLRVEEGLIEVGWDPTDEPPDQEPSLALAASRTSATAASPASEETIDDHYAALQAWTEWAKNQGRDPVADPLDPGPATAPANDPSETPAGSNVWTEAHQAFAPYSQLFSRLKQAKDRS